MNKKKKSTNTFPYPDEIIDRLARAFYPAILACWNSEEARGSLPRGRRNRPITPPAKKNRAFPTGNALLYISLLSVVFGRVRPIQRRTLFFVLPYFSLFRSSFFVAHRL